MLEYQEITESDINSHSKIYLDIYKNELTPEKKANTVTFAENTEEAYNNLCPISLIDASKIKEYTTVLKDGVYKFTLVLSDEKFNGKDVDAPSFTSKMFPVEKVSHFTNKAKTKFWYNESLDYNMTYNNCKLELTVDSETNKIISMTVEMNYDFEITEETYSNCTEHGYTEGVYCIGCEEYVSGHEEKELDKININELTPIEALNTLVKLKDMIK